MSEKIEEIHKALVGWRELVVACAAEALGISLDVASEGPSNAELQGMALELGGHAATSVVKDVLVHSARPAQLAMITKHVQRCDLVEGYPRSMYHMCLAEEEDR